MDADRGISLAGRMDTRRWENEHPEEISQGGSILRFQSNTIEALGLQQLPKRA
jgi:hypothetical protein